MTRNVYSFAKIDQFFNNYITISSSIKACQVFQKKTRVTYCDTEIFFQTLILLNYYVKIETHLLSAKLHSSNYSKKQF